MGAPVWVLQSKQVKISDGPYISLLVVECTLRLYYELQRTTLRFSRYGMKKISTTHCSLIRVRSLEYESGYEILSYG